MYLLHPVIGYAHWYEVFKTTRNHRLRTSHFSTGILVWLKCVFCTCCSLHCSKSPTRRTKFAQGLLNFKTTRHRLCTPQLANFSTQLLVWWNMCTHCRLHGFTILNPSYKVCWSSKRRSHIRAGMVVWGNTCRLPLESYVAL